MRIVFEEASDWPKSRDFEKLHFKMSSVLTETKAGVFEFLWFEERFSKALFRDG